MLEEAKWPQRCSNTTRWDELTSDPQDPREAAIKRLNWEAYTKTFAHLKADAEAKQRAQEEAAAKAKGGAAAPAAAAIPLGEGSI